MKFYLAYGSNLNKAQMRERCFDAKPVGKLLFSNARLVFRGVADVIYAPGFNVPCGLWRISPRDEAALDRYEGVSSGLYRKEMVDLHNGKHALIYLMNSDGIMPPSQYYVDSIRQGYKDFKLAQRYLDEAVKHSYVQKEPTEIELQRRARQRVSSNQQRLVRMPEALALKRLEQT